MTASLVIPALFVLAVSLTVLAYLLRSLIGGLSGDPRVMFLRLKLKRRLLAAEEIDRLLAADQYPQALARIRGAFLINEVPRREGEIEQIHNYHISLLSRALVLAEHFSVHIENLPRVEELVFRRSELLRTKIETETALARIRQKRRGSGQATPAWAKGEFDQKIRAVQSSLGENSRSLRAEILKLFEALGRSSHSQQVTYH